jgi:DNA-binding transcriptional ArsR family regulator
VAEQTPVAPETRSPDAVSEIPLDDVFEALADARRRRILRCLRGSDPPVEVGRIARRLSKAGEDVASDQALQTGLHHRDLPKLDALGVITYEAESKLVVDCRIEATEPYLDAAELMER